MGRKSLKVLFISSEAAPFAKTGGLADVAGSLPLALAEHGCNVAVAMPKYAKVDVKKHGLTKIDKQVSVPVGEKQVSGVIWMKKLPGDVTVYFIDNPDYFDRPELYGDKDGDYPDNAERFAFFDRAVLALLPEIDFEPDIVHCHDWQTALVPLYLKLAHQTCGTVYTIHNLQYQGLFPADSLRVAGLPEIFFNPKQLEFWGKVSFAKAGLIWADCLNTVSEQYSREIQTAEYGCGLEGVLTERRDDLFGIINGIDTELWDPATDKALSAEARFSQANPAGKSQAKRDLKAKQAIRTDDSRPLIGLVSRLSDQKGLDLVAEIIKDIVLEADFVLLGTGDAVYHQLFREVAKDYPNSGINLRFDLNLARTIYAGCDMFLIPSRYEPCGLTQMIGFRYGAVPIVRATGGLADTVDDYNPADGSGTGFSFTDYAPEALLTCIRRALKLYGDKEAWTALRNRVMTLDFSWEASAGKYVALYEKAIGKAGSEKVAVT